jgi:hypothetical protein
MDIDGKIDISHCISFLLTIIILLDSLLETCLCPVSLARLIEYCIIFIYVGRWGLNDEISNHCTTSSLFDIESDILNFFYLS